jgi:hypothetical protein
MIDRKSGWFAHTSNIAKLYSIYNITSQIFVFLARFCRTRWHLVLQRNAPLALYGIAKILLIQKQWRAENCAILSLLALYRRNPPSIVAIKYKIITTYNIKIKVKKSSLFTLN